MDRRRFLHSVFSSSLAFPLGAAFGSPSPGGRATLYVISDAPQDFLPLLLDSAGRPSLGTDRSLGFAQRHALAETVRLALAGHGWTAAASSAEADVLVSFAALRQPCPPSFALVRGGRVEDMRQPRFMTLWKEMSGRGERSSVLTSAAFRGRRPERPGRGRAAVLLDGRQRETLDLSRDAVRTYESRGGFVVVRVQGGQARVEDSSCRQRICVCSAAVAAPGERIICAPGRFVLQVEGRSPVDTIIG